MTEEEKSLKQREKNKRVRNRIVLWLSGIIGVLVIGYCVAVFSQIPFIVKWRTLYIETAMSTTSHQWLATAFIPHSIIDEVMLQREFDIQKQQSIDSGWELSEEEKAKHDELLQSMNCIGNWILRRCGLICRRIRICGTVIREIFS